MTKEIILIKEKLENLVKVTEEPLNVGRIENNGIVIETLGSTSNVETEIIDNPLAGLEYVQSKGLDESVIKKATEFYDYLATALARLDLDMFENAEQEELDPGYLLSVIFYNPLERTFEGQIDYDRKEVCFYSPGQWSTFGMVGRDFQRLFQTVEEQLKDETIDTKIFVVQEELYDSVKNVLEGNTKYFLSEKVNFETNLLVKEL